MRFVGHTGELATSSWLSGSCHQAPGRLDRVNDTPRVRRRTLRAVLHDAPPELGAVGCGECLRPLLHRRPPGLPGPLGTALGRRGVVDVQGLLDVPALPRRPHQPRSALYASANRVRDRPHSGPPGSSSATTAWAGRQHPAASDEHRARPWPDRDLGRAGLGSGASVGAANLEPSSDPHAIAKRVMDRAVPVDCFGKLLVARCRLRALQPNGEGQVAEADTRRRRVTLETSRVEVAGHGHFTVAQGDAKSRCPVLVGEHLASSQGGKQGLHWARRASVGSQRPARTATKAHR